MRIVLVRHGESQGNVDPRIHAEMADHAIPLSARGRDQAREAGQRLDDHLRSVYGDPDRAPHLRLWVSPYRRTRETATELIAGAGAWIRDVREHVLLCEQQFGLFDGIPDDELPSRFPDEWAHYDKCSRFEGRFWARMPLGESRFDVAQRVHQAFGTFHRDAAEHGIRDLVVICHGVTLRAFVMMWCHLSPEWLEDEPNPHNCAIRVIENGHDCGYVFDGFPRQA
ncbi:MAG: histidine phosphatase family protein [Kofleriaceae bacterium]|nr:histidine phosphatase family protein [Myxococcales bacterium]MCB9560977.1 histidine phosphatase family protein [Kofleriaceae bacterium]MCB9575018.1 histidine phosphatase family protein [Kofleriaceae bacterium]